MSHLENRAETQADKPQSKLRCGLTGLFVGILYIVDKAKQTGPRVSRRTDASLIDAAITIVIDIIP